MTGAEPLTGLSRVHLGSRPEVVEFLFLELQLSPDIRRQYQRVLAEVCPEAGDSVCDLFGGPNEIGLQLRTNCQVYMYIIFCTIKKKPCQLNCNTMLSYHIDFFFNSFIGV